MSHFKDTWNIQRDELIRWAADSGADWPDQDFDIAVATLDFSDIIIEYATNDKSPKIKFFLGCAYLVIGNSLRSEKRHSLKEIEEFLSQAKATNNKSMNLLCARYDEAIKDSTKFNYELWCNQGYANGKEN